MHQERSAEVKRNFNPLWNDGHHELVGICDVCARFNTHAAIRVATGNMLKFCCDFLLHIGNYY